MSILFPPKILNLRINTSIEQFYKDLESFMVRKGWTFDPPLKLDEFHWKSLDCEVRVSAYHPDKAIKSVQYALFMPGIKELVDYKPHYTYTHTFRIDLPREYPARVDKVRIYSESQLFHPRFSSSGWGEGCIHINGEIDRVLMDLVFQVLLDPERVRPPKFYADSDFGTNSTAMKWYQSNDPHQITGMLTEAWDQYRQKRLGKVRILDKGAGGKTKPRGPQILD